MITGEYIFYQDGVEIYRSKNLITKFGKRFFTTVLSGNLNFNKQDLAIGIANGTDYTVADTNSRLGFEFYRLPVSFGSTDIRTTSSGDPVVYTTTYGIVYKTTVPQDVAGIIKEVGLYPGLRTSINNYDSKYLSDFENRLEWYDSVNNSNPSYATTAADTSAPRIGDKFIEHSFNIGDTTSTTKEIKYDIGNLDISGYSINDTMTLAYNRANTNSSSIKIKLYSSTGNFFFATITPSGTGNKITEVSMSDVFGNQQGSPVASAISTIGIETTRASAATAATIYLDGLRINDEDTFDPTYGLISRSILATPITKVAGRPIDIEYKITVGF